MAKHIFKQAIPDPLQTGKASGAADLQVSFALRVEARSPSLSEAFAAATNVQTMELQACYCGNGCIPHPSACTSKL